MNEEKALSPLIDFHGDTIYCVEHKGEPYVPLKPIATNLGIDWSAQASKLRSNKNLWESVLLPVTTAGGTQRMMSIHVKKLFGFLASISPEKVGKEYRGALVLYQKECCDALWNYWTGGKRTYELSDIPSDVNPWHVHMKKVEAECYYASCGLPSVYLYRNTLVMVAAEVSLFFGEEPRVFYDKLVKAELPMRDILVNKVANDARLAKWVGPLNAIIFTKEGILALMASGGIKNSVYLARGVCKAFAEAEGNAVGLYSPVMSSAHGTSTEMKHRLFKGKNIV